VSKNFNIDVRQGTGMATVTHLFVYCGVIGVLAQGGIGRLLKKIGETKLIAISMLLVAVSLAWIPFTRQWTPLLIALALLSVGSSLVRPPVFGLISVLAPANEQGATIGVAQSAGSFARIAGPIFSATLFMLHPAWPYMIAGLLALIVALFVWPLVVPLQAVAQPVEVA